jgi:hypothetical protein
LGHAAIDEELDASDVATFVGSEEGDHFGNSSKVPVRPRGILPSTLSAYSAVTSRDDGYFSFQLSHDLL